MNILRFEIDNQHCSVDLARGVSLGIPLQFNGPQPNFFAAPSASAAPVETNGFTGDTRQGGSCNVSHCHLVPHCNGTHTECVGHVVDDAVAITEQLRVSLLPATLVTIAPRHNVIDAALIKMNLQHHPVRGMHTAFIIRTLPNTREKLAHRYDLVPPAHLAEEAATLLVEAGAEHLLVDLPSLDPMHDQGRLAAHHAFWGLPAGSRRLSDAKRPRATVTEMIYVPEQVKDGYYLLDLQIPAFMSDAAPSRPVIYPIEMK
ncbi:MAG TPA: cyclase family protein [Gammaproteobacteria bacterium]|nr:cyclase family protein [Gammaproteobacteria bacterium]